MLVPPVGKISLKNHLEDYPFYQLKCSVPNKNIPNPDNKLCKLCHDEINKSFGSGPFTAQWILDTFELRPDYAISFEPAYSVYSVCFSEMLMKPVSKSTFKSYMFSIFPSVKFQKLYDIRQNLRPHFIGLGRKIEVINSPCKGKFFKKCKHLKRHSNGEKTETNEEVLRRKKFEEDEHLLQIRIRGNLDKLLCMQLECNQLEQLENRSKRKKKQEHSRETAHSIRKSVATIMPLLPNYLLRKRTASGLHQTFSIIRVRSESVLTDSRRSRKLSQFPGSLNRLNSMVFK